MRRDLATGGLLLLINVDFAGDVGLDGAAVDLLHDEGAMDVRMRSRPNVGERNFLDVAGQSANPTWEGEKTRSWMTSAIGFKP